MRGINDSGHNQFTDRVVMEDVIVIFLALSNRLVAKVLLNQLDTSCNSIYTLYRYSGHSSLAITFTLLMSVQLSHPGG